MRTKAAAAPQVGRDFSGDHLAQIHLRSRRFDLRGRIFNTSVPDQMFRAQWAVEYLLDRKWIGPRKPLAVLGAGVAGISAVICALQSSKGTVPVYLVDSGRKPFALQRGVNCRRLDPTGYHWPHGTSRYRKIDNAPLKMQFDSADNAAALWQRRWKQIRSRYRDLIDLRWEIDLEDQSLRYDARRRRWSLELPGGNVQASAILDCRGFGKERVTFGDLGAGNNHHSFDFWRNDTLGEDDLGIGNREASILIAGAGDGGLQDFCRALTRKALTAPEMIRQLSSGRQPMVPEWLVHRAADLDFAAARSLQVMGCHEECRNRILADLHRELTQLVREFFLDTNASNACRSALVQTMKPQFRPDVKSEASVTLIYPKPHFDRCYLANHLTALLLAQLTDRVELLPAYKVIRVNTLDGGGSNPRDFVGKLSWVTVERDGTEMELPKRYGMVINRTGMRTRAENPISHLMMPLSHPRWKLVDPFPHSGAAGQR